MFFISNYTYQFKFLICWFIVLKKKLMKDGFFQELRERSYFTSKGEKRRKAKAAGRRRYLKKVEKRKAELGY